MPKRKRPARSAQSPRQNMCLEAFELAQPLPAERCQNPRASGNDRCSSTFRPQQNPAVPRPCSPSRTAQESHRQVNSLCSPPTHPGRFCITGVAGNDNGIKMMQGGQHPLQDRTGPVTRNAFRLGQPDMGMIKASSQMPGLYRATDDQNAFHASLIRG